MPSNAYTRTLTTPTPQSEPLAGQVKNSAGGHSWKVGDWTQLDRFLILGSEGATYYASERDVTKLNLDAIKRCTEEDQVAAVARIVEVSQQGLAPRNLPALVALAVACNHRDEAQRTVAYEAIPTVCRTGTDLFRFFELLKTMRGHAPSGPGLRRVLGRYFREEDVNDLAYSAVKYRQREGWTWRDILRLTHPRTNDPARNAVLAFMAGKEWDRVAGPDLLNDFSLLQAPSATEDMALILAKNPPKGVKTFPWEGIPDSLRTPKVWEALIPTMPLMALTRQLATFARNGLLTPMEDIEQIIVKRLTDQAEVKRSRVHPMAFLDAMLVHRSGGQLGLSRGNPYTPNDVIVMALEVAFYHAFQNVEPSNKRTYLAIDVSPSMGSGQCAGSVAMSPRVGATAMAMVLARTEPIHLIRAFSGEMVDVGITASDSLTTAFRKSQGQWSRTDCAQPILDALKKGIPVDTFVVLTDSETWSGRVHPSEALKRYRKDTGINARLVVVGMVGNPFTIADPADPGMLDVVGFSADAPALISRFSACQF